MADDFNPYSAPQAAPQPVVVDEGTGLKSLGQEARKTSLNKARWIMIALGSLMIVIAIFQFINIQNEIRDAGRRGMMINQDAVQLLNVLFIGTIVVGAIFIGMGIFVYSYPVPFTITALVLYLLDQTLGVVLGGTEMLYKGIIIKVLIIAGLWQAIQAARAFEQERRLSRYDGF